DLVPGLGEHLPEPDDARLAHHGYHDGGRRRLHRRATCPARRCPLGGPPAPLAPARLVSPAGSAGGCPAGSCASRGDPFWTISGGLAGVIGVSAGADVSAPTLAYRVAVMTACRAAQRGDGRR